MSLELPESASGSPKNPLEVDEDTLQQLLSQNSLHDGMVVAHTENWPVTLQIMKVRRSTDVEDIEDVDIHSLSLDGDRKAVCTLQDGDQYCLVIGTHENAKGMGTAEQINEMSSSLMGVRGSFMLTPGVLVTDSNGHSLWTEESEGNEEKGVYAFKKNQNDQILAIVEERVNVKRSRVLGPDGKPQQTEQKKKLFFRRKESPENYTVVLFLRCDFLPTQTTKIEPIAAFRIALVPEVKQRRIEEATTSWNVSALLARFRAWASTCCRRRN